MRFHSVGDTNCVFYAMTLISGFIENQNIHVKNHQVCRQLDAFETNFTIMEVKKNDMYHLKRI